jgi:hypothetical protein
VRDVPKAGFGQQPRQQTPEIPVNDPAVMQRPESLLSRGIESVSERRRAVSGDHASAINFLHQKPATKDATLWPSDAAPPRIYIPCDDRTILAEAIAQPTNNRTRTSPDLQTSPTLSNTRRCK